ncbi:hypothetical protein [Sulfurospirillum diekertiae]|nr:hypothetical protein [Sulfurospirillum diekertiae]
MNKKHGVGCTTLTYNLGRLFNIPIYVDKNHFMLDKDHKDLFPTVRKITASKENGILDIGADYNKPYVKKFISKAKVIVIPLDFGYETIIDTLATLKYLKDQQFLNLLQQVDAIEELRYIKQEKDTLLNEISQRKNNALKSSPENEIEIKKYFSRECENIEQRFMNRFVEALEEGQLNAYITPIILILNKLDKQDSERDFSHKEDLKNRFQDEGYHFDNMNLILTYLRNSYGLYSNIDNGGYFFDKFLTDQGQKDFFEGRISYHENIFKRYINNCANFSSRYSQEFCQVYVKKHLSVGRSYQLFLIIAYSILQKVDYTDTNIYDQDKDIVIFREQFKNEYKYLSTYTLDNELFDKTYIYNKETKLIKDIAYIAYSIFEYLDETDFKK